jgi:hypothetical protein
MPTTLLDERWSYNAGIEFGIIRKIELSLP